MIDRATTPIRVSAAAAKRLREEADQMTMASTGQYVATIGEALDALLARLDLFDAMEER